MKTYGLNINCTDAQFLYFLIFLRINNVIGLNQLEKLMKMACAHEMIYTSCLDTGSG